MRLAEKGRRIACPALNLDPRKVELGDPFRRHLTEHLDTS
jgi:hypothetical protein